MPIPGVARGGLRRTYDVVIVGGGIQGLALAYELSARGLRDICVLEAGYPGCGASGRNGELVRSAFSSVEWATFFDASLRRWRDLSVELGFNVLFTPAGYLVLASTQEELDRCRGFAARHRDLGLVTELLGDREVRELAPALNPELVAGGVYQPDGGFAHHDAAVWAYARAAARRGVEVHPFTRVTGIRTDGGRVLGVGTTRGEISTPVVVDAAGGHARDVAGMAGVPLPTTTHRLEAIVTESLAPFLRPALATLHLLGYCHQTTRGELVGGTEQNVMEPATSLNGSLRGLRDMAQKFVRLIPQLAGVRLLRHWAGIVDVTADLAPVLGPVPELEGFFLDCGWVYGFMGAPAAGSLLAEAIDSGNVPELIAPFSIERLRAGDYIRESSLVVTLGDA
ncbi:MAG: FAD-dependent oxidoreductase [Actinobacteria bacterium]|nr:FAD-dependent oxidoreductase [Actinomycetota bacterium]